MSNLINRIFNVIDAIVDEPITLFIVLVFLTILVSIIAHTLR